MYDVHSHILPGIDDGARTAEMALDMARMAAGDGITHMACTPHIYPGLFENTAEGIAQALGKLQQLLQEQEIGLELTMGADIQVVPEMLSSLRSGVFPTINGSRYFLFEPPHHIPLVHFSRFVADALSAGFVPIITHPERLSWVETHYQEFQTVARAGAWLQITSGSLTGRFGPGPEYWGKRMLDEGLVHLLASDAHNVRGRPPLLSEGEAVAAQYLGAREARRLVHDRPESVWRDAHPEQVIPPPALGQEPEESPRKRQGWFRFLAGRRC